MVNTLVLISLMLKTLEKPSKVNTDTSPEISVSNSGQCFPEIF